MLPLLSYFLKNLHSFPGGHLFLVHLTGSQPSMQGIYFEGEEEVWCIFVHAAITKWAPVCIFFLLTVGFDLQDHFLCHSLLSTESRSAKEEWQPSPSAAGRWPVKPSCRRPRPHTDLSLFCISTTAPRTDSFARGPCCFDMISDTLPQSESGCVALSQPGSFLGVTVFTRLEMCPKFGEFWDMYRWSNNNNGKETRKYKSVLALGKTHSVQALFQSITQSIIKRSTTTMY